MVKLERTQIILIIVGLSIAGLVIYYLMTNVFKQGVSATVSPSTFSLASGGGTVNVSGATPNGVVSFVWQTLPAASHGSISWSARADATGKVSQPLNYPGVSSGPQQVTVTDQASGETTVADFTLE